MGDPTPLIILSFCDIQTTLLISLTSMYWRKKVEVFWNKTKILIVYDHIHSLKYKKEALQWVTRYCRNLRIIDVRWNVFPNSLLVDLIRTSPLLEIYLTSYGKKAIFETIYEMCPHIKGLSILTSELPLETLLKFKSLTAIELGNYTSFLNNTTHEVSRILVNNPRLQIVHILGFTNTFELLESLRPDQLKSFSAPYEQSRITVDHVQLLQPFVRLENINFGQSSYNDVFRVLQTIARNHPNIQYFSFYPNDVVSEIRVLSHIANGRFFPCLEKLGCRIKPATRDAYTKLFRTRNQIMLYDYEQKRKTPHNWCYTPFDLWFLMKKYGSTSHKQW